MKHEVGHCKLSLSLVKQRMKDNYVHNWNGDISNTSRGILYNHTPCFQFQPYLHILTMDKFRISLSKIPHESLTSWLLFNKPIKART